MGFKKGDKVKIVDVPQFYTSLYKYLGMYTYVTVAGATIFLLNCDQGLYLWEKCYLEKVGD